MEKKMQTGKVEKHWTLENGRERVGSLDYFMFIQGERVEAIAFLGISQRRLPGKVPNYPGPCLPIPKDFLPAALLN